MAATRFHVFLVKPSHYDRDGYPIQWRRSIIPSNSLACLYGLTQDCANRQVLGEDVEFKLWPVDEVNHRVEPRKLIARANGEPALLALVGVQTNQFPRAVDIARPFLKAGIPVCVGGFHVSGCLAMLNEMPQDLVEAQDMGISFFLGEAEGGRLDNVFKDAFSGELKPQYGDLADLPDMQNVPLPFVPRDIAERAIEPITSFDLGRGCPFQCSFCSIINVHGRKSRFRTADDLERIIAMNREIGITSFFVTDDNLARNKNWEEMFDRLIELRENRGYEFTLVIQVDTMCHRIPGFIDKAVRAGVATVFIGLENINPANLIAAKKHQNRITEYREMFMAWKKHPVFITCGYIVGFPHDTPETIARDIEIIKKELPLDSIYFTYLTPLPGSADHKHIYEAGEYLDPDMNKYDLHHRVSHHPVMTDGEWDVAIDEAWRRFYTPDHMITVMKRLYALRNKRRFYSGHRLTWHYFYARSRMNHYKMEGGFIPMRFRRDRRHGMPLENPISFYGKYAFDLAYFFLGYGGLTLWFRYHLWRIGRDPKRFEYTDAAIAPIDSGEDGKLELFTATTGGRESVELERRKAEIIARAKDKAAEHAA